MFQFVILLVLFAKQALLSLILIVPPACIFTFMHLEDPFIQNVHLNSIDIYFFINLIF